MSPKQSLPLPQTLSPHSPVQPDGAEDRRGVPWGRPSGAAVQSGAAVPDQALSAVPAASGGTQPSEEAFEPDYLRWREQQLRALDEDYRAWREQGRGDLTPDGVEAFARWRAERVAASSASGSDTLDPGR